MDLYVAYTALDITDGIFINITNKNVAALESVFHDFKSEHKIYADIPSADRAF